MGADDKFCSKPDLWCVHEGATNQRKKCGGLLGHFCSDDQGDSGFSPCECDEGGPTTDHPGGECATWGHGEPCEGYNGNDSSAKVAGTGRMILLEQELTVEYEVLADPRKVFGLLRHMDPKE